MTPELKKKMDELAEKNTDKSNQSDPNLNYLVKKTRRLGFEDGFTAAVEEMEKINQGAREFPEAEFEELFARRLYKKELYGPFKTLAMWGWDRAKRGNK